MPYMIYQPAAGQFDANSEADLLAGRLLGYAGRALHHSRPRPAPLRPSELRRAGEGGARDYGHRGGHQHAARYDQPPPRLPPLSQQRAAAPLRGMRQEGTPSTAPAQSRQIVITNSDEDEEEDANKFLARQDVDAELGAAISAMGALLPLL